MRYFVAECLYVAFLDGGDQLVGEILTLYIYNAVFRMGAAQHVCDRATSDAFYPDPSCRR